MAKIKFYCGVSAVSDEYDSSVPFYEIPTTNPRPPASPCSVVGSFWYVHAQDRAERWERQSLLLETCEKLQAKACVINIPPSFALRDVFLSRVTELATVFRNQGKCPIYFDFGKEGPPRELSGITLSQCVSDPLWHQGQVWSDYWKIHGWHPERWVRKYSHAELKKLSKLIEKYHPRFLVLAHSQRREQWPEIANLDHQQSNASLSK